MADTNPSTIPDNFDERTDEEKKREEERKEASDRLAEKNKVETNEQDIIDNWEAVSKKDDWSNEQKLAYLKYKQEMDDVLRKEKDNLLAQGKNAIQEGFDPIVGSPWAYEGFKEDVAANSKRYEEIQKRKKAQKAKRAKAEAEAKAQRKADLKAEREADLAKRQEAGREKAKLRELTKLNKEAENKEKNIKPQDYDDETKEKLRAYDLEHRDDEVKYIKQAYDSMMKNDPSRNIDFGEFYTYVKNAYSEDDLKNGIPTEDAVKNYQLTPEEIELILRAKKEREEFRKPITHAAATKASQKLEKETQEKAQEIKDNDAYNFFIKNAIPVPKTKEDREELKKRGEAILEKEKEAIDAIVKSDEYKKEDEEIEELEKQYKAARKEITKKQTPYAIRNAFLIIDVIQKSLQNIGRALPQTEFSPAYTKTPFEEPELFKLWREQVEKGQELKNKQLEGYIDILKGNLGALGYDNQFINDFIRTKQGLINDWYKAGLDREQTKAMLNFEIDLGQNLNDLDEDSKDFLRTAQLYMAKDMNEALSIVLKDYMIKNPESVNELMNSLQGLLDSGVKITSELGNVINVLLNGFETQIKRINEIGFGAWLKEIMSGVGAGLSGKGKGDKDGNPIISGIQKGADEINPTTVTNNKLSKGLRDTMTNAVLSDTDLSDESRKSIFDKLNQKDVDMDDIINNNFYGSKKLKDAMGKYVATQTTLRTNSMDMNSSFAKMDKYIDNMNKSINKNDAKGARDNWLRYQKEVDKFNKAYTKERDLSSPFGKFMFWYGNNRQAVDAAYKLLMQNGYDINALPEVAYIDGYGNIKNKPGKNDTAINPRKLAYVLMTVGTGETAEDIINNTQVDFLKNPSTGEAYTISELSDKFSRDDYLELTDEQRHFLGANANIPEFKEYIDYRPSIEESTDKIVNAIEGKVSATNKIIEGKDAEIANLTGLKADADRAKEAAEKALAVEKRDNRIKQEVSLVPDVASSKQNAAIQALIDNTDMTLEEATNVVSTLGGGAAIGKDFLNDIGRLADAYALASVDPVAKGSPEAIFTKAQKTLVKNYPHMAKYFKNMNNDKLESLVKMAKKGGKFAKKAFKVAGPAAVVLQTADLVDDLFNITGNIQQNIENGEFYKNLTQPGIGKSVIESVHGDNADYIKSKVLSDNLLPYYSFRLTKYGPVAAINTLGATKNKKGDTVYSPEVKDIATWKGTTNDGNINITRGLLGSILYNKTGKENKDTGVTITSDDILKSMNLSYLDPKQDKKVIEEIYRKPYLLPVAWDSDFKQMDNKERLKLLGALDAKYGEQQFKNYRYK